MKIQDIKPNDTLYVLETNRKTFLPTLTTAVVQNVGKKRAGTYGNNTGVVIDLDIVDSGFPMKITLPAEMDGGIWEGVHYTPNAQLMYDEIRLRIAQTEQVINSVDKHKQALVEYHAALKSFDGVSAPPTKENLSEIMDSRLDAKLAPVIAELRAFMGQQPQSGATTQPAPEVPSEPKKTTTKAPTT